MINVLIGLGCYILIGFVILLISLYNYRECSEFDCLEALTLIALWPIQLLSCIIGFLHDLRYKEFKNPFYKEKK